MHPGPRARRKPSRGATSAGRSRSFESSALRRNGEVGDESPLAAIKDVLREKEFDEIIVSTLPPGISRWLGQDLVSRVERSFAIPVTHVIGDAESGESK